MLTTIHVVIILTSPLNNGILHAGGKIKSLTENTQSADKNK